MGQPGPANRAECGLKRYAFYLLTNGSNHRCNPCCHHTLQLHNCCYSTTRHRPCYSQTAEATLHFAPPPTSQAPEANTITQPHRPAANLPQEQASSFCTYSSRQATQLPATVATLEYQDVNRMAWALPAVVHYPSHYIYKYLCTCMISISLLRCMCLYIHICRHVLCTFVLYIYISF